MKFKNEGMCELTHKKGNFAILEYISLPHNYVTENEYIGDIIDESTFEERIS